MIIPLTMTAVVNWERTFFKVFFKNVLLFVIQCDIIQKK